MKKYNWMKLYLGFLEYCLFRESSHNSRFLSQSSPGIESCPFRARGSCYQGSRVLSKVRGSLKSGRGCVPLRRLSLSRGKTTPVSPRHRGHTNLATITKLKCQRCRIRSRKHCEAGIAFQQKNTQAESAARAPPRPRAERRALGPSGPSRRRREAERRVGLPPEPGDSRPTLAGALSPSPAAAAPLTRHLRLQRGLSAPRAAGGDLRASGRPGRRGHSGGSGGRGRGRPSPIGRAQPPLRRERRRQRRAQLPAPGGPGEAAARACSPRRPRQPTAGPLLLAPGRAAPPPVRTRRPSARAEAADGSGRPWS